LENFDWGSLIIQIVVCWFWYKMGQASIIRAITKDLLDTLKDRGIEVARDEEGKLTFKQEGAGETVIEIEKVGAQYFAYSTEGQFMGQGEDFKALFLGLKSRFPDQNFRIDKQQKHLTDKEVGDMVNSIFEVFGERAQKNAGSQSR